MSDKFVLLFYRNFMHKSPNCCHIGLGINTSHTVKVLKKAGVKADTYGIWDAHDIDAILVKNPDCTHAVIEAPFIGASDIHTLINKHRNVHFTCRCHSQMGFLQVEAGAIKLIRDYLVLQEQVFNFSFSVNNVRMGNFVEKVYRSNASYLPNLYCIERVARKMYRPPSKLVKIGSFGAIRLQKNHSTAAAAALTIAQQHNYDLEFYLSTQRVEHGIGVVQSIKNSFDGLSWAKLIELPWQSWPQFRQTVAHMDLCMQMSMSETFNITTADACAELVPCCVSEAIEWAPPSWVVHIDNPVEIANKGYHLLHDPHSGENGLKHLTHYVHKGTTVWLDYLDGNVHNLNQSLLHF